MKYQVIKSCVIAGSPKKAGSVVDVSDDISKELMAIGRIAPYHEPVFEDRAIGFSEDTKPRRRGRPKKAVFDAG